MINDQRIAFFFVGQGLSLLMQLNIAFNALFVIVYQWKERKLHGFTGIIHERYFLPAISSH